MKPWEIGDLVRIKSPFGIGWRVYRIEGIDQLNSRAQLRELNGRARTIGLRFLVPATEDAQ